MRGSDDRSELLKGQPPFNVPRDLPDMLQEGIGSLVVDRLSSEHRGPVIAQPGGRLLSAASRVPLLISDGRDADAFGVGTPKRGSRDEGPDAGLPLVLRHVSDLCKLIRLLLDGHPRQLGNVGT